MKLRIISIPIWCNIIFFRCVLFNKVNSFFEDLRRPLLEFFLCKTEWFRSNFNFDVFGFNCLFYHFKSRSTPCCWCKNNLLEVSMSCVWLRIGFFFCLTIIFFNFPNNPKSIDNAIPTNIAVFCPWLIQNRH